MYEFVNFTKDYEKWTDHQGSQKDIQLHWCQSQGTEGNTVGTDKTEIRSGIIERAKTQSIKIH